jgi:hypothetical protein
MIAAIIMTFLVAHLIILVLNHTTESTGANDVGLYDSWMNDALVRGYWPVRDFEWVYPALALLPMTLVKGLSSLTGAGYLDLWWVLIAAINAVTAGFLVRTFGPRRAAPPILAWAVFVALLGGPGMMRLDPLVPAITVFALVLATRHTTVAAALLTIGAWIKVAPAVVMVPLVLNKLKRWADVVVGGAVVCAAVVSVALLAGVRLPSLLGFVTTQSDRGLQVESVLATPVYAIRAIRGEQIAVYDNDLSAFQLAGSSYGLARAADFLLPSALLLVAWFAYRARSRGQAALYVAALAALSGAIVANKVGSPQFMSWMLAPMLVGLARYPRSPFWRTMAVVLGVCAALTHLIYPEAYGDFLDGRVDLLVIGLLRNGLVVAIFAASLVKLWRLGTASPGRHRELAATV